MPTPITTAAASHWRACTAAGYSNMAKGFGTNVGYATNGGSDTAAFFDSPGNDTYYAYADYNKSGKSLAGMFGSGVFQFGQRLRHERRAIRPPAAATRPSSSTRPATTRSMPTRITTRAASPWRAWHRQPGIPIRPAVSPPTWPFRPTAAAIRPNSSTRPATTRSMPTRITTRAGSPWRACPGPAIPISASGFGTNVGLFDRRRQRHGRIVRLARQRHVLCLRELQPERQAVGGDERQRVCQHGQRLRHQHRLCDQRQQRYGLLLRRAGQRHFLRLRGLQQQRPDAGGHVRQRVFQHDPGLRHECRLLG